MKATAKTDPGMKVARILLVDDHPIVRHGLTQLINHEPDLEVCGEARSCRETLKQLDATQPDVVIIDISLQGGNGIDVIKEIKSRANKVKMLVASMHDENVYAERALRAGAMGYVNKHEAVDEIVGAIRRVLQNKVYLSENMANRVLNRVVHREDTSPSPIDCLTDRELEVFRLIGQGVTTKQIANQLCLSVKTVETYRHRMKAKLSLASGNELTVHAAQWIMEEG